MASQSLTDTDNRPGYLAASVPLDTYTITEVSGPAGHGPDVCGNFGRTVTLTLANPDSGLDPHNGCDSQNTGFHNPPLAVTINATKIVCDVESDLPAFPFAGKPIDENTATTFLTSHPNCHAETGWDFEWGFGQAPGAVAQKQPGATLGYAGAGQGWNAFTGGDSATFRTATVPDITGHTGSDGLWVREVLKPGYLPFTDDSSVNPSFSAEIGCYNDAINYDNYDSIDNPVAGGTYYCVAWNVQVRKVTIKKVVTNVTGTRRLPNQQDALVNASAPSLRTTRTTSGTRSTSRQRWTPVPTRSLRAFRSTAATSTTASRSSAAQPTAPARATSRPLSDRRSHNPRQHRRRHHLRVQPQGPGHAHHPQDQPRWRWRPGRRVLGLVHRS